jgi:myosin heavy subunit
MAQQSNKNFASKDGNPRAASIRIGSCTAKNLAGQIRHDLRRGPQPQYVDADRSHLNRVIMEPLPPSQMRAICEHRRALRNTQRAMKSNSAVGTRGIITFGSEAAQMFEALSIKDQDRAFKLLARVVARRLATSVHGLTVHMDEATIHAHFQLAAYNRFGDPVSKSSSPKVLSELQDLTAQVMRRFCPDIERGRKYGERIAAGADVADTIHKSVAELHRTLPADLAAKRAKLTDLAQAETDAQARVDEMRDRVEKLTGKAELSDKEVKRLQTYEKRLADRVAELEKAQAVSEAARAEADRLADLARTDRQDEEARAEKIRNKVSAVTDAVSSLAEEISAGTISRSSDGKVNAASPDRLKPAYPEIRPAVQAAADFGASIGADRASLKAERTQLAEGQCELLKGQMQLMQDAEEIETLRQRLHKALRRVVSWLKRPELAEDIKEEGTGLVEDLKPLLKSAPEESSEDSGPGF